MAERRMFAKSIVLSDAFLDMPMSARCLYFTLAMFADDDGFVNNPKSIMRQCGASAGDMETLSTKKFVIFFDNGVIVIKHWRIHNYIQNDRYQKTKYLDEMDSLYLGDDKIYHVKNSTEEQLELPFYEEETPEKTEENYEDFSMYPECIQPVSKMDTQYSIGKDSIGKDNLSSSKEDDCGTNPTEVDAIITVWNTLADIGVPSIKSMSTTSNRYKMLKCRLREYGVEKIVIAINNIRYSPFLLGKAGKTPFVITFDWFIKPNNFIKVFEGNYLDRNGNNEQGNKFESYRSDRE